jgi:hypothetical protein
MKELVLDGTIPVLFTDHLFEFDIKYVPKSKNNSEQIVVFKDDR